MNFKFFKKSKYGNKKEVIDNITFASKKEAKRYTELRLLEHKAIIKNLRTQVRYELQPTFKKEGMTYRSIVYVADFVYEANGRTVVEDCKGFKTDVYSLKKKLFEFKYSELTILEV